MLPIPGIKGLMKTKGTGKSSAGWIEEYFDCEGGRPADLPAHILHLAERLELSLLALLEVDRYGKSANIRAAGREGLASDLSLPSLDGEGPLGTLIKQAAPAVGKARLFSKEEVFPEDGAWCDLVPMDSVVAYVFIPISSMPLPAAAGVSAGACRGRFLLAAEDPGNDREDLLTLKAMVAAGLIGLALTASGWGEDRTKLRILTHILSEEGYSIGVADDSGTLIDKTGAGFDAIKPGPMESLRQQLAVSDAEDGKGETRPRDLAITDMEGLKITAYPLGKHGTASRHMVTVKECDVASRIRNRREGLKLLSRFISSIAHEIKNPLTGIAAGVQYLAKKMQSGIREDETVEFILSEINRLNRIVDDLYKVAKPPQLALVRIDLNETVSKSLICMSEDITKKRLTVMQELNKALPELEADPDRLQQILINIIKNAIEASPEGGTLAIETFSTDSRVGIRVTDQGAGIGPEDRERIFEPFFSTKERGSGLGLCISQRIVDEHGGSIRVESPEGGGTSFVIELPTGR